MKYNVVISINIILNINSNQIINGNNVKILIKWNGQRKCHQYLERKRKASQPAVMKANKI